MPRTIDASTRIKELITELLKNTDVGCRDIRLLGITLSSLNDQAAIADSEQADLFESISYLPRTHF